MTPNEVVFDLKYSGVGIESVEICLSDRKQYHDPNDDLIKNLPENCDILQMMILDTNAYDNIYNKDFKENKNL